MTTPTRSGIPTTYAGTNFRSRLEARWAAFFDLIGWRWTYEPFDAPGYIPDYIVHGSDSLIVEVGSCMSEYDYRTKGTKADTAAAHLGHDVLIVGYSPVAWLHPERHQFVVGGLLGELMDDVSGPVFDWSDGLWARCHACGEVGIVHDYQSFHLRPCGHHQSGSYGQPIAESELEALWRRAGNDVQWRGPQSVASILSQAARWR